MQRTEKVLETIWFFLRPYKLSLLLLAIGSVVIGISEALHIAVLYPILSGTLGVQTGLSESFILIFLTNLVKIIPVDDLVIANSLLFILLTVLLFIFKIVYIAYSVRVSAKVVSDYRVGVFQRYVDSDYQFFTDHKQGELMYKAAIAPSSLKTLMEPLTKSMEEVLLTVAILILLFSLSWAGAIAIILFGVGYFYFARYLSQRVSYIAGVGRREADECGNVLLTEFIAGSKPIKIFKSALYWRALYNEQIHKYMKFWRKDNFWLQIPSYIVSLILFSVVAAIVIVLKMQHPSDFVSLLPVFGTLAFAIFKLLPRISIFGSYQMQIMGALPNLEIVRDLLRDKTYSKIKNGRKVFSDLRSSIEFRGVRFAHKRRAITLSDVSFKLENNKTTAIVGASGAGKSTIVDLLLRLYDTDNGEICIDGVDLKEYDISSVLGKIGFVGQETFIANTSVKENISFGNTYTMADIIEAAKLANAYGFIQELPEGYDTTVGDRGVKLSGGERQRIAIARAMIRKPEILILDEATSALDNIAQNVVQKAIDNVAENRTTLIIAHRLSTIRKADVVYVLDKGEIVESGTHNELIKIKGKYWESYNSQEGMTE